MKIYKKLEELENLKTESDSAVARQRGLDFEKLIRDYFFENNLLSVVKNGGFHTSDNKSEQIDGVISFEGKIFLLEVKWTKKLAASSLYEFIGKVENKFHGTLGIYISYNPLSENFLNALRKGRKQNVIVLHGNDIKTLLKEKIELKNFLKFVIEKLSFDNLPYISVEDYKESIKEVKDEDLQIDNDKINEFFRNSIVTNESLDTEIIERNLENLNSNEQATAYKKLFETAPKLLKLNFLSRPSYFNSSKFFRLYNPDFSNPVLKNLPADYFSKYIFTDPKIYLNKFIETYLNEFDNINPQAKNIFFDRIGKLLISVDFEEENNITMIIEEYEQQFPLPVKNEIHKIYIDFYYSSIRNEGFAQKHYSKELFARKRINRETITEWITKKIKNDLNLYKTKEKFNYRYFAYTYEDLGNVLDQSLDDWTEMIKNILYSLDKN